MVMSTIDLLREQLAIPSPARPLPAEPNYPAPASPGPRLFVPPADDGGLRYGDREPPDMPAPVLSHLQSWAGKSEKGHAQHVPISIPGPPDMPAPVLHSHSPLSRQHKGRYGRPAVEGLDDYGEMQGWGEEVEEEDYKPAAERFAHKHSHDVLRGTALDMEQQLEMVAMSLRGDQDEAAGVRRGLMMLQPFEAPRTGASSADSEAERDQTVHSRQGPAPPRRSRSDPVESPRGAPQVPACPTDYLHQIAAIESSVLKPSQVSSTWTAGQGLTAVCVVQWAARTKGELSLEMNETLDMSFFDASCMEQDWWFAFKADKQQTGSRLWRFPQDLGLLRKQAGYFPSKCVRLKGGQIPGSTAADGQRPLDQRTAAIARNPSEHKPAARQPSLSPAHTSHISFPVLHSDPTIDPPLVPFANVPLWLPTWAKVSKPGENSPRDTPRDTPKDYTPRDKKRDSAESLPLITSATDQTDTTFSFTPIGSINFAANVINDSDVDSPAASGPVSARSAEGSGAAMSHPVVQQKLDPGVPDNTGVSDNNVSANGVQDHYLINGGHSGAQRSGNDHGAPQNEFRRVQLMRNPNAPQNTPAGIGLQFARPKGQMGACHILALSTDGAAFQSGQVRVGNLIHEVDGRSIHFLPPHEITRLILGAPSSLITLTLSEGKSSDDNHASGIDAAVLAQVRAGDVVGVEESLRRGSLQANAVLDSQQWRALHFAAFDGHTQLTDLLLRYGADASLQGDNGVTAADLARNNGHHQLAYRLALGTQHHVNGKDKEAVKKTTVHAPGTLGEFSHKSLPKSQTRSELSSSPSRPIIPTLDLSSTQSQVNSHPATAPAPAPGAPDRSAEMRTVSVVRAPPVNGVAQTGVGIQFARPKTGSMAGGPYIINGLKPEGPAALSGLIRVGDFLHHVNGVAVVDLEVPQIAEMVLGPPSTPVALTISTPPPSSIPTPINLLQTPAHTAASVRNPHPPPGIAETTTLHDPLDMNPQAHLPDNTNTLDSLLNQVTQQQQQDQHPEGAPDTSPTSVTPQILQDLQAQPQERTPTTKPALQPQFNGPPMTHYSIGGMQSRQQPQHQHSGSPGVLWDGARHHQTLHTPVKVTPGQPPDLATGSLFPAADQQSGSLLWDGARRHQALHKPVGVTPGQPPDLATGSLFPAAGVGAAMPAWDYPSSGVGVANNPAAHRDWEQRYDPLTGRAYYVNHVTRMTSWQPPPPVASVAATGPASIPSSKKKRFGMFG